MLCWLRFLLLLLYGSSMSTICFSPECRKHPSTGMGVLDFYISPPPSLIYNLIGLQWLLIGKLDHFCYSRFSNISSLISQVWHSSPHMRFWFCSGQRSTTRLSFTGSSVYQFYVWFKSVMTWHILNRHVRYLLMDSGQVSLQLMRWFMPFRWIFFPYFCY
jgi:hypothetical protein